MKHANEKQLQEISNELHERHTRNEKQSYGNRRVEDQGKRHKNGKKFNQARSAKRNFTLGSGGMGDDHEEVN